MVSGRKVGGVFKSLVNARGLQLEFARILHDTLHVSVLMYDIEIITLKKEGLKLGCTDEQPQRFAGY